MGICQSPRGKGNSGIVRSEILRQKEEELRSLDFLCQQEERIRETLELEKLAAQKRVDLYKEKLNSINKDIHSGKPINQIRRELQLDTLIVESENAVHKVRTRHLELSRESQRYRSWKQLTLIRKISRKLIGLCKQTIECYWITWKSNIEIDLDFLEETMSIEIEDIQMALHLNEKDAEEALINNPIPSNIQDYEEKPMPSPQLLKLMGEILDKKYEADCSGKAERGLPEFAQEYLNRTYGIKKMARKTLSSIVKGLRELYENSDPYGVLLCRLLHLFDPQPILLNLSVYLTKARIEFLHLVSKGKKDSLAMRNSREINPHQQTTKNQKDSAFLIDVLQLMSGWFETDKFSRGVAIRALRPTGVSPEEYLNFRIVYRIQKKALNPEKLFFLMSDERYLNEEDLVEGLRRALEMYLPRADIPVLRRLFGVPVKRETFVAKLDVMKYYADCKKYTVTFTEFCNSLIESYRCMQTKDTAYLRSLYNNSIPGNCYFEDFVQLVRTIENFIEDSAIEKLFEECLEIDEKGVNADSFCLVAIKHGIGNFGLRDFRPECISAREEVLYRRRTSDVGNFPIGINSSSKKTRMSFQRSRNSISTLFSSGFIDRCPDDLE